MRTDIPAKLRLLMALGRSVRRRSDAVRFMRYFCRADEATAMPLGDPQLMQILLEK